MSNIHPDLEPLAVPVDTLAPYEENPRSGDLPTIVDSLKYHGQYRPVVARKSTGEVLVGNHTHHAAEVLGWDRLAAVWVDVDDTTAAKIVLVDNRTSDLGGYDLAALVGMLEQVDDLDGTGYTRAELDALIADVRPPDLDALIAEIGPPSDDVGWPTITVTVDPEVAEVWNGHLADHDGDEVSAMADLLGVTL